MIQHALVIIFLVLLKCYKNSNTVSETYDKISNKLSEIDNVIMFRQSST